MLLLAVSIRGLLGFRNAYGVNILISEPLRIAFDFLFHRFQSLLAMSFASVFEKSILHLNTAKRDGDTELAIGHFLPSRQFFFYALNDLKRLYRRPDVGVETDVPDFSARHVALVGTIEVGLLEGPMESVLEIPVIHIVDFIKQRDCSYHPLTGLLRVFCIKIKKPIPRSVSDSLLYKGKIAECERYPLRYRRFLAIHRLFVIVFSLPTKILASGLVKHPLPVATTIFCHCNALCVTFKHPLRFITIGRVDNPREMPSDRLTARIPTTPAVQARLREQVEGAGDVVDTYDDYLRVVLGMPRDGEEAQ